MHQRVDLQLRIFKGVRRWILHLLVDYLSNPGIQTDLQGKPMTRSRYAIRALPVLIHVLLHMYYVDPSTITDL